MNEFSGKYLLPHYWQKAGWILFIFGVIALYLRFGMGIKPDWLLLKVFTFYSSIFKTHYFTFTTNNISEEIGILLTGSGLFLIALAREKNETKEIWKLRAKSFIFTVYINAVIFLLCVVFIFGWGFMAYMAINLFLWLLIYIFTFKYLINKTNPSNHA